jgi:type VI secretion system protein ImpM
MSSSDRMPGRVGWFGKIPALGDFVGRGLPASLVRAWDAWLSAELLEARALLTEGWAAAYRQAPTLCFLLGADLLDGHAWQGILLPSFDRVGREYPLTIAQCRGPGPAQAQAANWWDSLVSVGNQVRESAPSADAVDEALAVFVRQSRADGQAVDPDTGPASRPIVVGPGRSAWWRFAAGELAEALPADFNGLPRAATLRGLFGLVPEPADR